MKVRMKAEHAILIILGIYVLFLGLTIYTGEGIPSSCPPGTTQIIVINFRSQTYMCIQNEK